MKDSNHSFLKVVLAYCLVIGLVLLWSGNNREKTVFDKYLISFKGLNLSCNHIDSSSQFFKEVLEFKEHDSQHNLLFFSVAVNFDSWRHRGRLDAIHLLLQLGSFSI